MKNFALLIIDMQNDFVLPDAPACVKNAYSTIPKIKKILSFFREKKWNIFHIIREYLPDASNVEIVRIKDFENGKKYCVKGTKGAEIVDELKPIGYEYVIKKPRFSAFMNTQLDFILKRLKISNIVICGTQYPNCIRCSAYDSISYGYETIVLTDATSGQSYEVEKANIIDMKNIGIECITVKEFIEKYG